MTEKYRYDDTYGKLYEWDDDTQAYVFVCANPFGLTEQELIAEYEQE